MTLQLFIVAPQHFRQLRLICILALSGAARLSYIKPDQVTINAGGCVSATHS